MNTSNRTGRDAISQTITPAPVRRRSIPPRPPRPQRVHPTITARRRKIRTPIVQIPPMRILLPNRITNHTLTREGIKGESTPSSKHW